MRKRNLIYSVLGLIVPGWGHATQGRLKHAVLIQVGFYGVLFLLALSRLIVTIPGIYLLILAALGIHLYSAVDCFKVRTKKYPVFGKNRLLSFTLFPIMCLLTLVAVFSIKPYVLGVQLYQVRSISMEPTLHDGDIIMVDTWKYYFSSPTKGDVVLFYNKSSFNYVKRIAATPVTPTHKSDINYHVLGDNKNHSIDSRQIGAISKDSILGPATIVLFGSKQNMEYIR